MAAEEILSLFDSLWFDQQIFTKHQQTHSTAPEFHQEDEEKALVNKISHSPSLRIRSVSDHNLMNSISLLSTDIHSSSPNSVLMATNPRTKLRTILSGKQISSDDQESPVTKPEEEKKPKATRRHGRRKKNTGGSKSLTDLEFEELKGFMDLGFVFSDEDQKDSSLVSMIPGLQRMGRNDGKGYEEKGGEGEERRVLLGKTLPEISRPYLSEAWNVLEDRNPVLENWKVPKDIENEVGMKFNLKSWAHTVASTVR